MKPTSLIFKSFLISIFFPFFNLISSDYIFFNNLDLSFGNKVYYSNLVEYCGTSEIESWAFHDEVLDKIKITDYKVAIFALGEYPLSVRTPSNKHFVIDKINQMIDSGKSVMIIAKNGLWGEFDPNSQVKHPNVLNFFTNTLGIEFIKRMPVHYVSGNTIYFQGYVARGAPKDPVGKADVKFCNQNYIQGATTHTPLDTILFVDVFKSKDPSKYFPVDVFTRTHPAPINDTLLGIRAQIGKSKILFWSYGFENIAGNIYRYSLIERAMNWLTEGDAQPGAQIESLDESVDFGYVYEGDSSQSTVSFRNVGSEPLIVSSIEVENFSGKNAFSIIDGGIPLTLKSGEVHTVTILFKPKEKGYHTDFLIIKSNSQTESEKVVNLTGNGEIKTGGHISVNLTDNKLDFGKTPAGEKSTKSFEIINTGNIILNIDSIVISTPETNVFTGDVLNSFKITPGARRVKEVFFQPKEEKIYNGTIRIYSDAIDIKEFVIDLIGEGMSASNKEDDSDDNGFSFEILANPENNRIRISINNFSNSSEIKLKVFSSNGKLMYNSVIESFVQGQRIYEINKNFTSGLYYITLENNNKSFSKPVIILK